MGVKREIYRGKYYIVLRDSKNKALDRVKWNFGTPIKSYRIRAKYTNSIVKGVERKRFTKVVETIDFRKNPRIPKNVIIASNKGEFQGVAKITMGKKSIYARSMSTTDRKKAFQEAQWNCAMIYSNSDTVMARDAIDSGIVEVGVVYYQPI